VSNLALTTATFSWVTVAGAAEYGLYIARDAGFTDYFYAAWVGNVLTKNITGMKEGTKYWVRSRAQNANGIGAYGAAVSFVTLSGVYYSTGTAWVLAPVYQSDGAVWSPAILSLSNGSTWAVPK
jgi:hypothetical protein